MLDWGLAAIFDDSAEVSVLGARGWRFMENLCTKKKTRKKAIKRFVSFVCKQSGQPSIFPSDVQKRGKAALAGQITVERNPVMPSGCSLYLGGRSNSVLIAN